jgi:hypothetical protein
MNESTIFKLLIILLINCYAIQTNAQVAINYDGSEPDASAILDIKSTDKGILIPRMTTTQQNNISSPAEGLLIYNTTTSSFWFFDGSVWQEQEVVNNLSTIQDNGANTQVAINSSDVISLSKVGGSSFSLKKNAQDFFTLEPSMNRTVIGQNAAINSNNSVFGYNASSTTLQNMTAFGMNSSMGSNNQLAIGANASLNTTTSGSITIGAEAGQSLVQFSNFYSTAIGYQAGQNGNYRRIALGHQAGQNITEHDFFGIDNSNTTTPLLFFKEDNLEINGKLQLTGNLTVPEGGGIYTNFNNQNSLAKIRVGSDGTVGIYTNGPLSGGGLKVRGDICISDKIIINGKDDLISSHRPLHIVGGKVSSGGGSVTYIGNEKGDYIKEVKRISKGYYKIVVDKYSGTNYTNVKPIILVTAYHDGSNDVNRYAQIDKIQFDPYHVNDHWEIFIEIRNHNGNKQDAPFNFLFLQRQDVNYTN